MSTRGMVVINGDKLSFDTLKVSDRVTMVQLYKTISLNNEVNIMNVIIEKSGILTDRMLEYYLRKEEVSDAMRNGQMSVRIKE